ncbi:MAG: hypothetical protein K2P14_00280 [Anaeroplasmataceae bacterium]|nr:hypothetical protein [Anaeroplasmataceae bacterium]
MEEREDGISLGEIFHVIFKKKWLLLGITIAFMLIFVVIVEAFYNPGKEEYQANFEIRYPNQETNRYPDGSEFLYKEFISIENLELAQKKDTSFSAIDISKMRYKNDISITEIETVINNVPVKTGVYEIKILKSYFENETQAIKFFQALINVPVDKVLQASKDLDYNYNLLQFSGAGDYISQINYLDAQKNMILENYNKLIDTYSNNYMITMADGTTKKMSAAMGDVSNYFSTNSLSALRVEVEQYGLMKENSDYKKEIEAEITSLQREKSLNLLQIENLHKEIDRLTGQLNGTITDAAFQPIVEELTKLSKRNAEIDHLITNVYDVYLQNNEKDPTYLEKIKSFEERLNTHYEKLVEFTNIYQEFYLSIYETQSKALVSAGSIITSTGGISVFLTLGASLVLGILVGCCVNLILDLPKYLRSKKETSVEDSVASE